MTFQKSLYHSTHNTTQNKMYNLVPIPSHPVSTDSCHVLRGRELMDMTNIALGVIVRPIAVLFRKLFQWRCKVSSGDGQGGTKRNGTKEKITTWSKTCNKNIILNDPVSSHFYTNRKFLHTGRLIENVSLTSQHGTLEWRWVFFCGEIKK